MVVMNWIGVSSSRHTPWPVLNVLNLGCVWACDLEKFKRRGHSTSLTHWQGLVSCVKMQASVFLSSHWHGKRIFHNIHVGQSQRAVANALKSQVQQYQNSYSWESMSYWISCKGEQASKMIRPDYLIVFFDWNCFVPSTFEDLRRVSSLSTKTPKMNCEERGTFPALGLRLIVDIAHMRSCVAQ